MMKTQENFTYMLFDSIASNNDLSLSEKMVAMFIYTFHHNGKKVRASNRHIARCLNMPESTCHRATSGLVDKGLIGVSNDRNRRTIGILQPELTACRFKQFHSSIIRTDLEIGAKFLFVYILSFLRDGKPFYDSNANIKTAIGLGRDWVASAAQELVRAGLIKILNPKQPRREYYVPKGVNIKAILDGLKPDEIPQSVPKVSVNRIDVSAIRNAFPTEHPPLSADSIIDSPSRTNYRSNDVIRKKEHNVSLLDKSNNRSVGGTLDTEGVDDTFPFEFSENSDTSTEGEFLVEKDGYPNDGASALVASNSFSSPTETLSNDYDSTNEETDEITYSNDSNGTRVTIDDLVNTISTASPEDYEGISKHLQLHGISVKETLTSEMFTQLSSIDDLTSTLTDDNRIALYYLYDKGEYYYFNELGGHLTPPSIGFDARLFYFTTNHSKLPATINEENGTLLIYSKMGIPSTKPLGEDTIRALSQLEFFRYSKETDELIQNAK